jgi:hypothetical protein
MLVFIDESGDAGLKLAQGSSRYFIIALVVFEEHEEATACDQRIQLLKRELKLPAEAEFKFRHLRTEQRQRFYEAVLPYNFFYFGIVINKEPTRALGAAFQVKESFYNYACGLVFENAKPYLREAIVVIDGSGSQAFKRELSSYLRRKVGGSILRKVKIQTSHSNHLLQLADMVVGAIQGSFSEKTDRQVYRRLLAAKEISVHIWPR